MYINVINKIALSYMELRIIYSKFNIKESIYIKILLNKIEDLTILCIF